MLSFYTLNIIKKSWVNSLSLQTFFSWDYSPHFIRPGKSHLLEGQCLPRNYPRSQHAVLQRSHSNPSFHWDSAPATHRTGLFLGSSRPMTIPWMELSLANNSMYTACLSRHWYVGDVKWQYPRPSEKISGRRCEARGPAMQVWKLSLLHLKPCEAVWRGKLWRSFPGPHCGPGAVTSTQGKGSSPRTDVPLPLGGIWTCFFRDSRKGRESWPNLLTENSRKKRQTSLQEMKPDTYLRRAWASWYPLWQSVDCYHLRRVNALNPKNWKSWGT